MLLIVDRGNEASGLELSRDLVNKKSRTRAQNVATAKVEIPTFDLFISAEGEVPTDSLRVKYRGSLAPRRKSYYRSYSRTRTFLGRPYPAGGYRDPWSR